MKERDFLFEFIRPEKELADAKPKNNRLIVFPDGTTRFLIQVD